MENTHESLGRKMAELDLTAAEAEALVEALGGRVTPDVAGFEKHGTYEAHIGIGELQECTISKGMLGELRHANWFIADSFSFGVERE